MERLRWQVVAVAAAGFALALEALPWLLRRLRAGRPRREVLFFPSQVTCTEAPPLHATAGCCPTPTTCSLEAGPALLRAPWETRWPPPWGLHTALGSRWRPWEGTWEAVPGRGVRRLPCTGIQVRHDQDLGYMHHKFAIVDKQVLITGSLNWTTQAIQNNRENVLIMEDAAYVKLFLEEFERIWEEFDPTKYSFFPQKKRSR
uniref:Mitochondrial cardiolipin hydrolase n=1 Tax=Spermophilus dauricus TaxID=99837 RepID=A0A8C9UVF2_SPEDA